MAADVSALVRVMKAEGEGNAKPRDLITRDLLGGCDLSSRRLDLLAGNTYLDRSESESDQTSREVHDLNLPPPPAMAPELDLSLLGPPAPAYQSVCTLEKVRSALERAEREARKGSTAGIRTSPSPASSTTSSSAAKRRSTAEEEEGVDGTDSSTMAMIAAGCPGCLLYVLISRRNPRCPRCDSHVPVPVLPKRPRIELDLNSTSP